MASLTLELPPISSKEDMEFWLESKGHHHLKPIRADITDFNIREGDALRSKEGFTARVVHLKDNKIVLANNKLSKDEMHTYFNRNQILILDRCPYCGNLQGSPTSCPSGCFDSRA
jgi:hypothetical protein